MLAEELAKAGIRLRSMRVGDHKTLCPQCSATRKNKTDPCLSVTVDDAGGAVWMCHNCQWAGNVPGEFKRDETRRHRPVQPVKPIPVADPKRPDAMYKWFAGRGIGARVVDKFGIHRIERGGVGFLVFPYYWQGELVNNKYRSADKQFRQDKDAERTVYNIDAVKDCDTIIWVEGECFPSDAEVLTPRGWVSFESLDPSDRVAQWDGGKISFVSPLAHVRKRFTGNLIQFTNKGYVSRTTPNHYLVSIDYMGRLRKTKASAFPASTSDVIPRCGVAGGEGIPLTNSQLIVALAVAADGTVDYRTGRSNHKPKEMRYCRMGLKKRRKIERILEALSDCEITPSVSENADTGYTTVCFSMPDWIPGKTFPVDWIAQATATQREFLLSELVQWDGNSVVNRNQAEFSSKHESEASWVQALAHTSGFCSTMMFRKNSYGAWWKVSILYGKQHSRTQNLHRSEVFYDGDVYCVTVPSGMLMVRQDRKITISGNCDVLALDECGVFNAVSLPDGAPSSVGGGDKRYEGLGNCKNALAGKKYVLAGDMDSPGLAHREELARRLGKVNCSVVSWPEDCKDANETLINHGPDKVIECLNEAKPYPIEGLYEVNDYVEGVLDLYQNGRKPGLSTGWTSLDEFYTVKELDLCIVLGIPNNGKALDVDTVVPTPNGWTTMGEIKIGDSVYDENGAICSVTNATEVMKNRECFEITFSDGAKIVADADHQWAVNRHSRVAKKRAKDSVGGSYKLPADVVMTTKQMYSHGTEWGGKKEFRIAYAGAIAGNESCPVPPYTLGAWLGDGSSASGVVTNADLEVFSEIEGEGFTVLPPNDTKGAAISCTVKGLKPELRKLGVLGNKHIPQCYMRATIGDRLALLQGLMDTDGYAPDSNNVAEFCSTNEILALQVAELARTLGLQARVYEGRAMLNGKDCGAKYRVAILGDLPIFRISRKAVRWNGRKFKKKHLSIKSIEPVESRPVRCIAVSSPSRLFLVGKNFTPTHNSNFMDALAVNMARLHGWKFGVCSFETMPVEHISTIAEKIAGKPFSDGFTPKMDPTELRNALGFAQQHFFFIRGDEQQPTVDFILERAADAVLRHGIKGLIIDPYNEIEHARGDKNETEYVSDLLSRIRRFNRSHGVTTWLICHPTKLKKDDNGTVPPPTLYDAMGSSHFNNKADSAFTVHRPDFNSPLTHIYVRKIRHRWTGKPSPTPIKLRFIGLSGDYSDDLQGL